MKNTSTTATAEQILKNCAAQLLLAYEDLDPNTTPITVFTKIEGAARAIQALSDELSRALGQCHRTIGGLQDEVERLRRMNSALSSRAIQDI